VSLINIIRGVAYLGALAALLFGSAGRWDLPFFWAYIGVNVLLGLFGSVAVDPGLQQERWHPAKLNHEFLRMLFIGGPLYVGHLVVAGLDVGRFHWSDGFNVPIQLVATAVFAAGWGLVTWAVIVNRFFSPVMRIQEERGHHLITSGPYRFVRHPGYAGAIVGFLSAPLLLGSWWSLVTVSPLCLFIVMRTIAEDRFLHAEFAEYSAYAARVRCRLIPGIW
jgi:protein-S-isoprenylcysteine O-methyltransferase Ste14